MLLKITNNIKNIKIYNNNKYYYKINKINIIYYMLANEYYFITNYPDINANKLYNLNLTVNIPYFKYEIQNGIINIENHILSKIIQYKQGTGLNIYDCKNILTETSKYLVIIKFLNIFNDTVTKVILSLEDHKVFENIYNVKVFTIFIVFYFRSYNNNTIEFIDNGNKNYIILQKFNELDKIKDIIKNSDNVIIYRMELFPYEKCITQFANISWCLYLYNKILQSMKNDANLYLLYGLAPNTKPIIQLLYFMSTLFESFAPVIDTINFYNFGYLKFGKFKGYKNDLNDICKKLIKLDPYLGQNATNIAVKMKYCDNMTENKKTPNNSIFIESISDNKISKKFIKILEKSIKSKKHIQKKFMTKVNYMYDQGDKLNIDNIIYNNITHCINFCKKNNIIYNDIYKDNKIVNSDNIIKKFFVNSYNNNKIDTTKIKLSIDAMFSITEPKTAKQMSKIINKSFPSVKYMIDGCANIGTTTIIFAQYFKHVYSIEYDIDTFNILKNNIGVYNIKNTTLFHDDTTLFMKNKNKLNDIKYDINTFCLCLDPPWEGVFYKLEKTIDLYLSNINILDLIKDINVKYICIKAPHNYNLAMLYKYFYNVTIYRLSGFYFILIVK
jgi:16S rRNA G966 N2-methylase RsmD